MSETVLVVGVGAVAGIGAAVARKFAGAGYHVVVSGRTREKLETVVLQIQETGGSADYIVGDVTFDADQKRLAAIVQDRDEPLAAVIYNAALCQPQEKKGR